MMANLSILGKITGAGLVISGNDRVGVLFPDAWASV